MSEKLNATYLCMAWGETDFPAAAIVTDMDTVRAFLVEQWLGSAGETDDDGVNLLDWAVQDMQEQWALEGDAWKWEFTFEIGGVSVQRVGDFSTHQPARELESASRPNMNSLAGAMRDAAIRYAIGHTVDFQHEAREFLLESASQPGDGEDAKLDDMLKRFKIRMTPYGMLVRALRIVSGTTLMDMANYLGVTPATLSGMEFGRKPVTVEDAIAASNFFALKGIDGTLWAMTVALRAAPSAGNGGAEG